MTADDFKSWNNVISDPLEQAVRKLLEQRGEVHEAAANYLSREKELDALIASLRAEIARATPRNEAG